MTPALLWELTLGSWLTAALILLVRPVFGRWLTPRGKMLLWFLLLLRLLPLQLLPIHLPLGSPVSLMRYAPDAEAAAAWLAPSEGEEEAAPSAGEGSDRRPAGLRPVLRRVWLAGMGTVFLASLILYLLTVRRLKTLPPCGDLETEREYLKLKQLCRSGFSPRLVRGSEGMLGGFFRPALVIPAERVGEGAAPILLHELMHYQGGDLWLAFLFRLFCAAYWFNPVLWLCFWLFRRDAELACDRRVLDTGLVSPKTYAGTLLEEFELRGSPDPMPLARFGAAGVKRRIRDILQYRRQPQKPVVLTACLCLVILFLAVLSPSRGRSYGFDRSIPAQVGYPDTDAYIAALQPSLGAFGLTRAQLTEAGYLEEGEGVWVPSGAGSYALSVKRDLGYGTRTLRYVFKPTLYTEREGTAVLTEIQGVLPPRDGDFDWQYRALGRELLYSSPELNDCHAVYEGKAEDLLRSDRETDWGLLDWMRTREAQEEFFLAALHLGYQTSYNVRCTPVTLGDCLTREERDDLAERILEKGWAGDGEAAQALIRGWHLMGLINLTTWDHWSLTGMGIALYRTRPGGGQSVPQAEKEAMP